MSISSHLPDSDCASPLRVPASAIVVGYVLSDALPSRCLPLTITSADMKLTSLCLASALLASTSLAAPNNEPELQAVFDGFDFNHVAHEVADTVVTSSGRKNVFDKAKKLASDATSKVRTAFKDGALRDFVESQGIACEFDLLDVAQVDMLTWSLAFAFRRTL